MCMTFLFFNLGAAAVNCMHLQPSFSSTKLSIDEMTLFLSRNSLF